MAPIQSILAELQYQIVRQIYEGGMGVVYEARQLGARGFVKRVAIKVIRERLAKQEEFLENFVGEAKLVADLIHTNIVQTYLLAENQGYYFICMELIRGVNLEQFLQRLRAQQRELPLDLAVFIVSRVARGLAYAHSKTDPEGRLLGIVHRDVSLKNIMIAFEGDVKLTDFGIAKARGFLKDREGEEVAGKPEYMSPEQADFQITDRRSDIFSAGVVLSELLLGRNIFRGRTPEESRQNVIRASLPNFSDLDPRLDEPLNALLHKAMARMPGDRFQTADEFLTTLERMIYGKGYGPTNEKLGQFIRDLFPDESTPQAAAPLGGTTSVAGGAGTGTGDTQKSTSARAGTEPKTSPSPVTAGGGTGTTKRTGNTLRTSRSGHTVRSSRTGGTSPGTRSEAKAPAKASFLDKLRKKLK